LANISVYVQMVVDMEWCLVAATDREVSVINSSARCSAHV